MGLMDFIKGELLEIIQWQDDSRDTIAWRFPDDDKAIKNGAQLIVRESQTAQFVYLGQFGERAPALNSASQSVYEGFVHLHRQAHAGTRQAKKRPGLPGVRDDRRGAYDAGRNPIFLGEVQGRGIRPVRRLIGETG